MGHEVNNADYWAVERRINGRRAVDDDYDDGDDNGPGTVELV